MTAPAAYLLAYFSGEEGPTAESVRFALSEDGVDWDELDGGDPIITSTVGTGGMRDPFLLRTSTGFVLLATDLLTWPDGDWIHAVRRGSRSLVIAESMDLVNWSPTRLVEVAPPDAGNAWAPKAYPTSQTGVWAVFFASACYPLGDGRHESSHQRILRVTTIDFRTFTPPTVFLDRGYDTIDLTFLPTEHGWYRLHVDHLDPNGHPQNASALTLERGGPDDLLTVVTATGIGSADLTHGEGPAVIPGGPVPRLLIDEFGLRGYQLFEAHGADLSSWRHRPAARIPPHARHGSVLALTGAEAEVLRTRRTTPVT